MHIIWEKANRMAGSALTLRTSIAGIPPVVFRGVRSDVVSSSICVSSTDQPLRSSVSLLTTDIFRPCLPPKRHQSLRWVFLKIVNRAVQSQRITVRFAIRTVCREARQQLGLDDWNASGNARYPVRRDAASVPLTPWHSLNAQLAAVSDLLTA